MRFCYALLVVAGAFFGSTPAISLATATTHTATLADAHTPAKEDVSARFLRTAASAPGDDDDNERLPIPFSSLFMKRFSSIGDYPIIKELKQSKVLGDQTPPIAAFEAFGLDKAGVNVFTHEYFEAWVAYTKKAWPHDPIGTIFWTLQSHFHDDAILSEMLVTASKVKATHELATEMQTMQIGLWVSIPYTARGIFYVLKLDNRLDDLLDSPLLPVWTRFLDVLFKRYPASNENLIVLLRRIYKDDARLSTMIEAVKTNTNFKYEDDGGALSKMVEEAMKDPDTKVMATAMSEALESARLRAIVIA